jgi:transcriptional regulator with XRE-family HTH domain
MVRHSPDTVKSRHRETSATSSQIAGRFSSATYLAKLLVELDRAAISRRIAQAREQAGLRQPELAESLREPVHFRTVQMWERGQRNRKGEHQWVVPWDRLGEIAEITGVTKEWLLHGEELPAADPSVSERLDRIEQAQGRTAVELQEQAALLRELISRLDPAEPPRRRKAQ